VIDDTTIGTAINTGNIGASNSSQHIECNFWRWK